MGDEGVHRKGHWNARQFAAAAHADDEKMDAADTEDAMYAADAADASVQSPVWLQLMLMMPCPLTNWMRWEK